MQSARPDSPFQFALLEHTTAAGIHWDLLVEVPGQDTLATWRLLADPLTNDSVPAESIGNHRRIYLEFEGDIGGSRGTVRRIDRGTATISFRGDETVLDLNGRLLYVQCVLTLDPPLMRIERTRPRRPWAK